MLSRLQHQTSSTINNNTHAFYFYHRIIRQCGTTFLICGAISGASLSLLMFFAADIIQKNKMNLLSFSKSLGDTKDTSLYFKLEEEQEQSRKNDDDDDTEDGSNIKRKSSRRSSSSTSTNATKKMIQFQYNQFLASLKKSWLFRVIDEHARDGEKFGSNVLDELLNAWYSSFYSFGVTDNNVSSDKNTNNNNKNNKNNDRSLLLSSSSSFKRSRIVLSAVTRYFVTRFASRAVWGLLLIATDKFLLSKLLACPRTGRSLLSEEFTDGLYDLSSFNKNFELQEQQQQQDQNNNNNSNANISSIIIHSMLELSLFLDFHYYGLSWRKFPTIVKKISMVILTCWNPAGAPCFLLRENIAQSSSSASTSAAITTADAFVMDLVKEKAGFRDVITYRVLNLFVSEYLFTISTRIVDIVRESFFTKVVDNQLTYELQHLKSSDNNNNNNNKNQERTANNNNDDQAAAKKDLFDENGKALASINPNHQQQRGGSSSSRVATTKRTTTLSRREQVAFFFGRFKKLGKDIVRNLIPKMVIGSAKAAACTYLLRSALGEKRISWFTSSAICFMFMY